MLPTAATPREVARAWPRIGAWLIDWLWILLGLAALVPLGLVLRTWEWTLGAGAWNALTFVITVLPVTLWLAWREAAPRGATPGKRRRGLRVVDDRGALVPFRRTLARNVVKVAIPWELGHTVAFGFATTEVDQAPPAWLAVSGVVVYAVMGWFVASLFVGSRRTPYDRLSGTRVVRQPASS